MEGNWSSVGRGEGIRYGRWTGARKESWDSSFGVSRASPGGGGSLEKVSAAGGLFEEDLV